MKRHDAFEPFPISLSTFKPIQCGWDRSYFKSVSAHHQLLKFSLIVFLSIGKRPKMQMRA